MEDMYGDQPVGVRQGKGGSATASCRTARERGRTGRVSGRGRAQQQPHLSGMPGAARCRQRYVTKQHRTSPMRTRGSSNRFPRLCAVWHTPQPRTGGSRDPCLHTAATCLPWLPPAVPADHSTRTDSLLTRTLLHTCPKAPARPQPHPNPGPRAPVPATRAPFCTIATVANKRPRPPSFASFADCRLPCFLLCPPLHQLPGLLPHSHTLFA